MRLEGVEDPRPCAPVCAGGGDNHRTSLHRRPAGDLEGFLHEAWQWPTLQPLSVAVSALDDATFIPDQPASEYVMVFLGDDLLAWLLLALGGALVVGTGLALIRPRPDDQEGDLDRPPLVRSLVMIALGLVAAIWALASLASS